MFLSHPLTADASLGLLEPRHAEELFALTDRNRAYLRRWLPWLDDTRSPEDSRAFIKAGLQRLAEQNGPVLGIWMGQDLVGVIEIHSMNWYDRSSSIGYWLSEEWQGRGLMTLACRALLDYAFRDLRLDRLEIHAATENRRSRAIPERLGFRFERVVRQAEWLYDHYVDHAVYVMLAAERPPAQGEGGTLR